MTLLACNLRDGLARRTVRENEHHMQHAGCSLAVRRRGHAAWPRAADPPPLLPHRAGPSSPPLPRGGSGWPRGRALVIACWQSCAAHNSWKALLVRHVLHTAPGSLPLRVPGRQRGRQSMARTAEASGGSLQRVASWRPPRPRREKASPRLRAGRGDDGIVENTTATSHVTALAASQRPSTEQAGPARLASRMSSPPVLHEAGAGRAPAGKLAGGLQRSLSLHQPARRRSALGRRGLPPSLRRIPPVARAPQHPGARKGALSARQQPVPSSLLPPAGAAPSETPAVASPWRARVKDEPAPLQLSPVSVPSMRPLRLTESAQLLERAHAAATCAQSPPPRSMATMAHSGPGSPPTDRLAAPARASWPTTPRLRRRSSGGPPSLRGMVRRVPGSRNRTGEARPPLRHEFGEHGSSDEPDPWGSGVAGPVDSPLGGGSEAPSSFARKAGKRVSFKLDDECHF